MGEVIDLFEQEDGTFNDVQPVVIVVRVHQGGGVAWSLTQALKDLAVTTERAGREMQALGEAVGAFNDQVGE